MGKEQEVDGGGLHSGGQGRRTAPATGEAEENPEQKSRCSGRKKRGEGV
jgi:hypothetical protein